ncbi:E3 ubiquitin-protein ligase RHF2A, partial [Cucurbita argyrosperma subsp. argyrosperma]
MFGLDDDLIFDAYSRNPYRYFSISIAHVKMMKNKMFRSIDQGFLILWAMLALYNLILVSLIPIHSTSSCACSIHMESPTMDETKKSEAHLTSAAAFVEGGIQDACDDACSICLENFCDSDPSTMTSCKHEFHLQCVLEWYLFIFLQYLFEISD